MKIRRLYSASPVTAEMREPLVQAARRMVANNVGALAVVETGRLIGIVTERDVVRAAANGDHPARQTVAGYMTVEPAVAHLDEDSEGVANRMLLLGIRHLPVVEERRVVGMISARDLLALAAWPAAERR